MTELDELIPNSHLPFTEETTHHSTSAPIALPHGWTNSTVGASLTICNNLRFPINVDERKKVVGKYPYYGPTGVLDYISEYRLDGKYALIGEDGDHFLKYEHKEMTFLINGKCNVNNHAHVIASGQNCDVRWFYYYFMHRRITEKLTRQGVGRYKLTKASLMSLSIALPPLAEQRAIVEILDAADAAVRKTQALIDAKRQYKRALGEQLLTGARRFSQFAHTGDWCEVALGDVFVESSEVNGNLLIKNVITVGKNAIRKQSEHFTRSVASGNLLNYKIIRPGDFVYDPMSSYYGAIGRYEADEVGIVSPAYRVIRAKSAICADFWKHQIKSHFVLHQLERFSTQGNQAGKRRTLQRNAFNSIAVFLPPTLPEQQAIAECLSLMDDELRILQAQCDAFKRQKAGLMQQLLTGRVRLPQFRNGADTETRRCDDTEGRSQ